MKLKAERRSANIPMGSRQAPTLLQFAAKTALLFAFELSVIAQGLPVGSGCYFKSSVSVANRLHGS